MTQTLWIVLAVVVVLLLALLIFGLMRNRRGKISLTAPVEEAGTDTKQIDRSGGYTAASGITFSQSAPAEPAPSVNPQRETGGNLAEDSHSAGAFGGLPTVGDDATVPRDAPKRSIEDLQLPEPELLTPLPEPVIEVEMPAAPESVLPDVVETPAAPDVVETPAVPEVVETPAVPEVVETPAVPEVVEAPAVPGIDTIAPTSGRLERLRGRLAKSQNALGKSMLGLLGGGDLDEDSWEEVEDTLLIADLGPTVTAAVLTRLRGAIGASAVRTEADARAVLREALISELHPEFDRSIKALPHDSAPSVLLVVGVNGTGKTTTVGKLARVLVADGRRVVLGAADTFRAAAADQLEAWGTRVGAEVVRGPEGADPASIAFDAVDKGIAAGADVVVVDTAGRLHTKTGLMDELGKVKRVVSKRSQVDEVLLVLDATVGQNGLMQAKVFSEVVDITGVVLTKLDGTAKGGIVFRVQEDLGVPVKLVGLGEGPDDLAPFEPAAFVDALLG